MLVGATFCNACPGGSYATSTACIYCVTSKYGPIGISSVSGCVSCPANSGANCPWQCTEVSSCSCNSGYTGPNGGPCVPGTTVPCSAGTTGPSAGPCSNCAAGKYKTTTGSAACSSCTTSKYSTTRGASDNMTCIQCPSNSGASCSSCSEQRLCFCNAGYSNTIDGDPCLPCPAGSYKDYGNLRFGPCVNCYDAYSSTVGATAYTCTACPSNTFCQNNNCKHITDCICTYGMTGPNGGPCEYCPPDTFKNVIGSSPCALCDVSEKSGSGATYCQLCGPGDPSCTVCPPGTYKTGTGSAPCLACPFGTSNALTTQASCNPCMDNSNAPDLSVSVCYCNPGYTTGNYFNTSYQRYECVSCNAGTYKANTGDNTCVSCPFGTWNTLTAQASCNPCMDNSNAPDLSLSVCYCNPGYTIGNYFNTSYQRYECVSCINGTYKANTGDNTCAVCDAGKVSGVGAAFCTAVSCNAGYSGPVSCTACAAGTYKQSSGSESCVMCPVNTVTLNAGSVSVSDCVCAVGYEWNASYPLRRLLQQDATHNCVAGEERILVTDTLDTAGALAAVLGALAALLALHTNKIMGNCH